MIQTSTSSAGWPRACASDAKRVVCPICGPADTALVGTSNQLPVVRCCGCGLVYVSECQDPSETQEFFRKKQITDPQSTKTAYVDYRRKSLERGAARIRNLVPGGGRLLDVGTASGFFLRQFVDHPGWKTEGVEPSRVSADYARRTFGVTVHDGFLAEQNFPASCFDVVCSLDAFCCHRTPREDMQEFFRILAPGGFLAIEIPGHRFRMLTGSGFLYRTMTGRSLRLNAGVNFFYYTRETLTRLAGLAGFEFVESHPEGMPTTSHRMNQVLRNAVDAATGALYRLTNGRWNFSAKELCIFRKPQLRFNADAPSSVMTSRQASLRAA